MTKVLPEELMNSVLGQLYDVLCNGDETVPASEDNFLTWVTPGIPYRAEDLSFVNEGFTGILKGQSEVNDLRNGSSDDVSTEDDSDSENTEGESTEDTEDESGEGGETSNSNVSHILESSELSEAERERLLAWDTTRKFIQAESFARLADMIPDTSGIKDGVSRNIWNQENSVSQVYEHILRFNQVADFQLSEDEKKELEKRRSALVTKIKTTNPFTGVEEEKIEDSPLVKLYEEKRQIWMSAALEYNNKRIRATAARKQEDVTDWALNGDIYRSKVRAAERDWIQSGYKNEYEENAAVIAQMSNRSMPMLVEQYKDDLAKAAITGVSSASNFYYTTLVPGSFIENEAGWTEFEFSGSDYERHSSSKRKSYGGGGGFFFIGGRAKHEKTESHLKVDTSHFSLSFKICQVPIVRPWFNVNFITSNYWRMDQSNESFKDEKVSDGGNPPQGMMPAYSTTAIFIRDLKFDFGESHLDADAMRKHTSAGGFFSYGGFSLGGRYGADSAKQDVKFSENGQSIEVDGMQLIGFKCHTLKLSPNPKPSIKNWI